MVKKGDEIEVKILELNSEGKGVSKIEGGFVIFSDKALPGYNHGIMLTLLPILLLFALKTGNIILVKLQMKKCI